MTRFFSFNNKIKVNVANGTKHNIWCRVDNDQTLMKQGATGGSPDVHDIGDNTHKAEQVQHTAEATPTYNIIRKGNTLALESSTPSNSIYMTVLCDTGRTICKTHEIGTSTNYIISSHDALLNAEKNQMWIDTNGCNHMVTYDDEDGLNKKECSDHSDFRPEIEFTT
jgi:hypothetical protein